MFNPVTGDTHSFKLAAQTDNPSFIAIDPTGRFLYAVNEMDSFNHEAAGAVSAFVIHQETATLELINQVSSIGAGPAHLSIDQSGKFLLVANYTGGNISVFELGVDGRIGKNTAFVQHTGTGKDSVRQSGPHAHYISVNNNNQFVLVADLGIDKIMIYKFNDANGTLEPANPPFIQMDAGAGPRHFAFAPSGNTFYVLNELNSSVSVFDFEQNTGRTMLKQTIPTLPENFTANNTAAEICIDPDGKFLYVSNRGDNSIAQFKTDPINGLLTIVEWVSTQGKAPRHFEIDPTGRWMFVANQKSDKIAIFSIDQESGKLEYSSHFVDVIAPVCIQFLKMD